MATVALSRNLRRDIRKNVVNLIKKYEYNIPAEQDEIRANHGYKSRTEFFDAIVESIHGPKHWAYIKELMEEEDAQIKAAFGYNNDKTSVRMGIETPSESDNCLVFFAKFPCTYPGVFSSPGYYGMGRHVAARRRDSMLLYTDNPMYGVVRDMVLVSWRHDRRVDRASFFVNNFLDRRNTGGQVRRDWPELVEHFDANVQHKLGDTVARKVKDWPEPTREDRDYMDLLIEDLVMAQMLPSLPPNFEDKVTFKT